MKENVKEALKACIVTCSSLAEYVEAAQISQGTAYQVVVVDHLLHTETEKMKDSIAGLIAEMPEDVDTVLVAMGFCGGVWDHVTFNKKVVIPRVGDCVSLLLHKDNDYHPHLKEDGHLYYYKKTPSDFSLSDVMYYQSNDISERFPHMSQDELFHILFDNYYHLDIIDTGLNDCYSEEYAMKAQENADRINVTLNYVEGSNLLLEKLVSGRWDEQFVVAEPGKMIQHGDFF